MVIGDVLQGIGYAVYKIVLFDGGHIGFSVALTYLADLA
jgi:hypothetical protein